MVKAKATGTLPKLNDYIGEYWASNGDTTGFRSNLPPVSGKGGPACAVLEHLDNPLAPVVLEDIPDPNATDGDGTLQFIGMSIPQQRGTFKYDASTDSVKLTWSQDSTSLEATKLTYRILEKRNTTVSLNPNTELMPGSHWVKNRSSSFQVDFITAHPLGGAVLGKACDEYGRVFGYQGLYVVDGALIPGSTACTNPSLTIAALAERCMDRIITEIS